MNHDPLNNVVDKPLHLSAAVIGALRTFRAKQKLLFLPGVDPTDERNRLEKVVNELTDTLLAGVESHPKKLWVMAQFQHYLAAVEQEDTEGREHFGAEVEEIMDILSIESSDGLLAFYLGGL